MHLDRVQTIRPPAVAGLFYPGDATELSETVDGLLAGVTPSVVPPKALIAPHAGYIYSGPIAATAYAQWVPIKHQITRVVILGPAHRVGLPGMALPGAQALRTPLGDVAVDASLCDDLPRRDDVHAQEHSLEVHLPFLQRLLPRFEVVPICVGWAEAESVADLLERLWGDEHTHIVVSSDLSHYLPYAEAQQTDAETAQSLIARHPVDPEQACGAHAVNGLMLVAKRRGLQVQALDLRNSGDTQQGRERVVGYGAFAVG